MSHLGSRFARMNEKVLERLEKWRIQEGCLLVVFFFLFFFLFVMFVSSFAYFILIFFKFSFVGGTTGVRGGYGQTESGAELVCMM